MGIMTRHTAEIAGRVKFVFKAFKRMGAHGAWNLEVWSEIMAGHTDLIAFFK